MFLQMLYIYKLQPIYKKKKRSKHFCVMDHDKQKQ